MLTQQEPFQFRTDERAVSRISVMPTGEPDSAAAFRARDMPDFNKKKFTPAKTPKSATLPSAEPRLRCEARSRSRAEFDRRAEEARKIKEDE